MRKFLWRLLLTALLAAMTLTVPQSVLAAPPDPGFPACPGFNVTIKSSGGNQGTRMTRLKDGIAEPLKRIVETRFPKLEDRLKKLAASLTDPQTGKAEQTAAREEADAILVEMKQVLDKMLELETCTEALDLLREIIQAQEKVQEKTKQTHRSF